MEEKRTFERFKIEFPVRFLDVNVKKEGSGKIIDISAGGGGMLVTQSVLEPGASLEMWLHIPDNQEPFHTRGEVVWSKEVGSGIYRAGVKFDSVDFMNISRVLRMRNKKDRGISSNT
jgi:c-di-GMP-binding flagellar brake protein YcgR